MGEPRLTTVPRDLYYHKGAYVRGLERALDAMLELFGKPHKEEYVDGGASYELAIKTVADARAARDAHR